MSKIGKRNLQRLKVVMINARRMLPDDPETSMCGVSPEAKEDAKYYVHSWIVILLASVIRDLES